MNSPNPAVSEIADSISLADQIAHIEFCAEGARNTGYAELAMELAILKSLLRLRSSRECGAGEITPDLAGKLLRIRDAMTAQNYDEAYHVLYSIASPRFDRTSPWAELCEIAALKTYPALTPATPSSNASAPVGEMRRWTLRDYGREGMGCIDFSGNPFEKMREDETIQVVLASEADALISALREELAALNGNANEGWRPIESAPKYKEVLVYREDAGVMLGIYTSPDQFVGDHEWDKVAEELGDSFEKEDWFLFCWNGVERADWSADIPTQWRDLPAAPALAKPKGDDPTSHKSRK